MKNNSPMLTPSGRTPATGASSARTAVLGWVQRMSSPDRDQLRHRLRGAAPSLEATDPIRGRIDRHESALVVALFLEYAGRHGLSPAEAESLLSRPGSAGPRALELLGLVEAAPDSPGRNAQTRACHQPERATRTPGR